MFLNEEFLSIYEELSKINSPLTESSFDNEEVYGEAAKTIPGLVRYFVANIETLGAVIERERILASTGESKKASDGKSNGKKLPFVSFSHQLFSHAYRRGSSWKYGVVVDQNKLEQKVQTLTNHNIEDNYVHENKSSRVFGAARLSDGTDMIMTSYGQFEIDLNDTKRRALGNIPKTGYYEKVKDSFNKRLAVERAKHIDGHANTLTVESFYCTEVPEVIKRYLKTNIDVLEGFLLVDRRASTGVKFTDICSDVPGLFDYLQDHTTLNEGELRVWLPKGEEYLDISGCIVGVVLPSNYKENNLDDDSNNAHDVMWIRKLLKERGLKPFYYTSTNDANIPDIDQSRKTDKVLSRPSIIEYFHKVTSSREAVIEFVRDEMERYYNKNDLNVCYLNAMSVLTTTANGTDIHRHIKYNYRAFLKAISEFDLNEKDLKNICLTGSPLVSANQMFNEKTKSYECVKNFLQLLGQSYTISPSRGTGRVYNKWFVSNTNAQYCTDNTEHITPQQVDWISFADLCLEKYNLTRADLNAIARGESFINKEPINMLFKKAATTNKKTTKHFIQDIAKSYPQPSVSISQAYRKYMGNHAIDTNSKYIDRDTRYNYSAWLEKVTDPNGPIKLTIEEILAYFREFRQEINNNK